MTIKTSETEEILLIEGVSTSMSRIDIQRQLWDGTLEFSTLVRVENNWVPLSRYPLIYKKNRGAALSILGRLEANQVPYLTLLLVFIINVVYWLQDIQGTSIWGNSWSNIFLEGRWWSIFSGIFVHSSRMHVVGNVTLLLFLGWRVEKALGTWPCFLMLIVNMCISSVMTWFVEGGMVVGASSIVFTLWGAQITIGLLFTLPPRYAHRYGWWGLILLMFVFVYQVRVFHMAHAVHLTGLVCGALTVLFLHDRTHWNLLMVCVVCLCSIGFMNTMEKRVNVDGMSLVLPKDFVTQQVGVMWVWYHPFQTSGWVVQGVNSHLEGLNDDWTRYEFNTDFNDSCMGVRGCVRQGESHHVRLRIVHFSTKNIYWIACVYDEDSYLWSKACADWIQKVTPQEPPSLRRARILSARYPDSTYYLEQYGLSLEDWGFFLEADRIYQELLDSKWRFRAITHRARIREYYNDK